MESLLLQASIYLGAAVLVVPLAVRYGLGSVLGYIAAGILMAPVLRQIGANATDVQHIAEFGVVLMLFLIGLELEPKTLWAMRGKLIGTNLAPSDSYVFNAASTAARTSADKPSPKNSWGTPMRSPATLSFRWREKSSAGTSSEVASRSKSGPHMADNNSAQSSALRPIGPPWSRLDAKAIMP